MRTKNKAFFFVLALSCVLYQKSLENREQRAAEPKEPVAKVSVKNDEVAQEKDLSKQDKNQPDRESLASTPMTIEPNPYDFMSELEMYDEYYQDFKPNNPRNALWNTDLPQIDLFQNVGGFGFIKTR